MRVVKIIHLFTVRLSVHILQMFLYELKEQDGLGAPFLCLIGKEMHENGGMEFF